MSGTSLSAVRLVEAEVCLSRPCRLSVWWRLWCVCHVTVGCPSGGGCGVSVTSLSAVRLAEAEVCLSRRCRPVAGCLSARCRPPPRRHV